MSKSNHARSVSRAAPRNSEVLSNQRGLRPRTPIRNAPRTLASWRQWLLRVVAATAGAWWIDGRGRSTYVLAFFVYSRHWLTKECFDFPRRVLLLTAPGDFYWSVPRESWCSFPLVFLRREQWSELRLCSVTTESQEEWILYLRLTVSQCSSSDGVALILHFIQP